MDRDLLDFAEIDLLPHRDRIVVGLDNLHVPLACLRGARELDRHFVAAGQRAGAENNVLPVIGLAGRNADFLNLVSGLVRQVKILASFGESCSSVGKC